MGKDSLKLLIWQLVRYGIHFWQLVRWQLVRYGIPFMSDVSARAPTYKLFQEIWKQTFRPLYSGPHQWKYRQCNHNRIINTAVKREWSKKGGKIYYRWSKNCKMKRTRAQTRLLCTKKINKGGWLSWLMVVKCACSAGHRLVVEYISPCSEGGVVNGCADSAGCNIDGGGGWCQ